MPKRNININVEDAVRWLHAENFNVRLVYDEDNDYTLLHVTDKNTGILADILRVDGGLIKGGRAIIYETIAYRAKCDTASPKSANIVMFAPLPIAAVLLIGFCLLFAHIPYVGA